MSYDPWEVPPEHWCVALKSGTQIWVPEATAMRIRSSLGSSVVLEIHDVTGCRLFIPAQNISHVYESTATLRRRDQQCRELIETENDGESWRLE